VCGQGDTTAVDIRTDVFHRLQHDAVRAYEDDVAVVPDQLGDKLAFSRLPVKMERQNPLPRWLGDIPKIATADPLAQQEEQRRGGLRATPELLGHQKHSWMVRVGRDQQLMTLASVQLESN
jgi:hypothetical protein